MSVTGRAATVSERTSVRRSKPKTRIHPFLFVAPSVLMLALLLVLPIGQAFLRTFQSDAGWGMDNYVRAVRDDHLARLALRHTFLFAFFSVVGQYLIGFAVALLLNERLPFRGMFRVLFLLPWMFPAVVPGITWRWIFDGLFGVLNEVLYRVHYYDQTDIPTAWLGQTSTALAATVVANVWRGFPFMMVLLLAGLQAVNGELYEAASVDGASRLQRFRDITVPAMRGISMVAILLAWIGSFMNFAIVQVMTAGGPANASEVFATLIYKNAFLYADANYAATLGILLLLLLMIPGGLYVRQTMRSNR
ncbi:MAG: multiple sugar transport system permease protein [Thermomicrobiales bacterium]|jgi:multiple sugar transport system permease protein|nr:multiple sugar transport system permease protein [Thermomicrobiales bacterium]MEA2527263.1 multiple sugar transport system permease protein [Thermomicrobiales bacterium]MEA2530088.1 multiple sugar transport system permease protein [Thermomicrobiales bacterium]